jgi:hypothetical protein
MKVNDILIYNIVILCDNLRYLLQQGHKGHVLVSKSLPELFKNCGSELFKVRCHLLKGFSKVLNAIRNIAIILVVQDFINLKINKQFCVHDFRNMFGLCPEQPLIFYTFINTNRNVIQKHTQRYGIS